MVYTNIGESVQAKRIAFQCRKFHSYRPRKDKAVGKLIFPVCLSIFGIAKIDVELTPKKQFIDKPSALNKDDEIRGGTIRAFSIKQIPDTSVKNATGKHKANFTYSKDKTYAEIEALPRHIQEKK